MKKSLFFSFFAFCSAFGGLHSAFAQEIIYVDISNTTGIEDGSPSHPFNTIQEGLAIAQNGNVVLLAEGIYPEDSLMISSNIAIQGQHRDTTWVEGIFILAYFLDTTEVSISKLSCNNVLMSEANLAKTPLTIQNSRLQTFTNDQSKLDSTFRLLFTGNIVDDSIHLYSSVCMADIQVEDCTVGSDFSFFSASLRDGKTVFRGNQVNGNFTVSTVSKKDTLYIEENEIQECLDILSVASHPDFITNNTIGKGMNLFSVSSQGFHFLNNQVLNGRLIGNYSAISNAEFAFNEFSNGGIDFNAKSAEVSIRENNIQSDGQESGIRLITTSGGYLENNTITLPYVAPTGIPFENDTSAVCGMQVNSVSFPGMKGNHIRGGSYGAYIQAVSAGDIVENFIEESHTGMYISTVSARIDSCRIEQCVADGLVIDLLSEYDTSSVLLNYNLISKNGGHGIRLKGITRMGKLDEPFSGYNITNNNDGFDLYIESPATLMDTIWAQNNGWSHRGESEVGQNDIYDGVDDPALSKVVFSPLLPYGIEEKKEGSFRIYPNPSSGKFNINNSGIQKEWIEVLDLFGKVVITAVKQESGEPEKSFDVSSLPAGVYFVRMNTNNHWIIEKMIKR